MQTTHWPIQCHLTPCHSSLASSIPSLSQSSTPTGQALRSAWEPFNDFGQLDDTAHSETTNKDTHTHAEKERDRGITTTNSSGWSTAWPLMDASDRSIADAMAINCCVSRAPPEAASTRVEIGQKFNIFACVQSKRERKGRGGGASSTARGQARATAATALAFLAHFSVNKRADAALLCCIFECCPRAQCHHFHHWHRL